MTHQMSSAMFRAIAGLCRTMVVANTGGSFALLIIFMLGGFIMPRTQIKPWWIWGYWSSPLAYAQTSITVNEFLAPRWMKVGSTKTNAKKKPLQKNKSAPISSNWKLTF
jgi:ABC-type multidrug transport system permease subunit